MYIGPWQEMKLAQRIAAGRGGEGGAGGGGRSGGPPSPPAPPPPRPPRYVTVGVERSRHHRLSSPSIAPPSALSSRSGEEDAAPSDSSRRSDLTGRSDPGPRRRGGDGPSSDGGNRARRRRSGGRGGWGSSSASSDRPDAGGGDRDERTWHRLVGLSRARNREGYTWDDRGPCIGGQFSDGSLSGTSLRRGQPKDGRSLRSFRSDMSGLSRWNSASKNLQPASCERGGKLRHKPERKKVDRLKHMRELYVRGAHENDPPSVTKGRCSEDKETCDNGGGDNLLGHEYIGVCKRAIDSGGKNAQSVEISGSSTPCISGDQEMENRTISAVPDDALLPACQRSPKGTDLGRYGKLVLRPFKLHDYEWDDEQRARSPSHPSHTETRVSRPNTGGSSASKSNHITEYSAAFPLDKLLDWAKDLDIDAL